MKRKPELGPGSPQNGRRTHLQLRPSEDFGSNLGPGNQEHSKGVSYQEARRRTHCEPTERVWELQLGLQRAFSSVAKTTVRGKLRV